MDTEVFNASSPKLSFLSSSLKGPNLLLQAFPQFGSGITLRLVVSTKNLKGSLFHFPPQLSTCKCHTGLLVMSFQDLSDVSACLPPHCHCCYLSKPPSSHSEWLTRFLSHPFQFILNHGVKLTTSECRSVNNTLLFKILHWFSTALRINSHHD